MTSAGRRDAFMSFEAGPRETTLIAGGLSMPPSRCMMKWCCPLIKSHLWVKFPLADNTHLQCKRTPEGRYINSGVLLFANCRSIGELFVQSAVRASEMTV